MLTLVIGGAASGKSGYAEQLAVAAAAETGGTLYYLATMHNDHKDPETLWRIDKHRRERAGKGFETIERESGLSGLLAPEFGLKAGDTVLLEDLSNLLANEMFFAHTIPFEPSEAVSTQIAEPILALCARGICLIAVSNQIAEEPAAGYDPVTQQFILGLQKINGVLGAHADRVYEVVCGIPLLCGGMNP